MKHTKLLSLLAISALNCTLFIPHKSFGASEEPEEWMEITTEEALGTEIDPRTGKDVDTTYGTASGPTLIQQLGGWWTNLKGTLGQATEQAQQVATGTVRLAGEFAHAPYDEKVQKAVGKIKSSVYHDPNDSLVQSLLSRNLSQSVDTETLQAYLSKAKDSIKRVVKNYIAYLSSRQRYASDEELNNPVSFLEKKITLTLQPLSERITRAIDEEPELPVEESEEGEEAVATEPIAW